VPEGEGSTLWKNVVRGGRKDLASTARKKAVDAFHEGTEGVNERTEWSKGTSGGKQWENGESSLLAKTVVPRSGVLSHKIITGGGQTWTPQ